MGSFYRTYLGVCGDHHMIPMCMDYSLFASELPFFLFIILSVFEYRERPVLGLLSEYC